MRKNWSHALLVLSVLVLTACSQGPQPTTAQAATKTIAEPPQTVSGKTAFWEMHKAAYNWSHDVQPLLLTSKELTNFKNEAGKAAVWTATFGSASKAEAVTFTYSITEKRVNASAPIRWAGATSAVMPFQPSDVNTDSTDAFEAAAAEAKTWLAKNADKSLSFTLGSNFKFRTPVWYVLWGNQKAGYAAYVDATNGKVIHPK